MHIIIRFLDIKIPKIKNIVMIKKLITVFRLLIFGQCALSQAPMDSLIRAHSYVITIDKNEIGGTGKQFLDEKLTNVQFVNLAEEHNVTEVNKFSTALFRYLKTEFQFGHVALEQGPIVLKEINKLVEKGKQNP